jgi:hypothetical protein
LTKSGKHFGKTAGAGVAFKTFASEHGDCLQQNEINAQSEGIIHPMTASHRMNRSKAEVKSDSKTCFDEKEACSSVCGRQAMEGGKNISLRK